jgi:hypothetical protein
MTAKTPSLLLLGALALSACTTAPPPLPQPAGVAASAAPEDRLIAALETQGCVLTSANVEAVLLAANLTQADLPALTNTLAGQGRIEPTDGTTIRVLSDNCI